MRIKNSLEFPPGGRRFSDLPLRMHWAFAKLLCARHLTELRAPRHRRELVGIIGSRPGSVNVERQGARRQGARKRGTAGLGFDFMQEAVFSRGGLHRIWCSWPEKASLSCEKRAIWDPVGSCLWKKGYPSPISARNSCVFSSLSRDFLLSIVFSAARGQQ
jgi:hypothetical protein